MLTVHPRQFVQLFIHAVDVGSIPKFYSQGGYLLPVRLCDRLQLDGGLYFIIGWNSWGIWGIAVRLEGKVDSDLYITYTLRKAKQLSRSTQIKYD